MRFLFQINPLKLFFWRVKKKVVYSKCSTSPMYDKTNQANKQTTRYYHLHAMSFSRYPDSNASLNDSKIPSEQEICSTVYVLTRIEDLCMAIRNLSNDLSIKEINVPVESDVLDPSSLSDLGDARIAVVDPKLLAYNYKSLPKLEWAFCTWAGVECLFEIMNEEPKFIITRHGNEDFTRLMAEYVMAQILILEKNFKMIWAGEKEKSWSTMQKCISDSNRNRSINEITLGILGVGNMGKGIASFFKPHGTRLIGLGRRARESTEIDLFDKIEVSLTEVLASSDYIINTLPSTSQTVGLLNGDTLQACKKMPVFINVGRGNIINENALLNALENNWLSHAVLDVFQKEPLSPDSLLWNSDKVTITPHCAAMSQPRNVAKDFLRSYSCYKANTSLNNIVNWKNGY